MPVPLLGLASEDGIWAHALGTGPRLAHYRLKRVQPSPSRASLLVDPLKQLQECRDWHLLSTLASSDEGNVAGVDPAIERSVTHTEQLSSEMFGDGLPELPLEFFADRGEFRVGRLALGTAQADDVLEQPFTSLGAHYPY